MAAWLVLLSCTALPAFTQISAVSLTAGTVATSATASGTNWVNPTNVLAADNVYTTCAITGVNKPTYNLDAKTWGFQTTNAALANYIPPAGTINGIEVTVKLRKTGTGSMRDNRIFLLKAGAEAGVNKARSKVAWPATGTSIVFGGSSDLWGTTWTPADLINTGFGFRIVGKNKGSQDVQAEIDYVSIKIYFNQAFYYSKSTGDIASLLTWGRNSDGSGANPANFSADGQVFLLRNRAATTLATPLAITGLSSKLVVGDSVTVSTMTIPSTAALSATVDVSPNASLTITNTSTPVLNTISDNTTVTFNAAGPQNVTGVTYYNLTLGGSGTKTLQAATANSTYINNVLTIGSGVIFDNAGSNIQALGTSTGIVNNGTMTGAGSLIYSLLDVSTSISGTGSYSNLEIDAGTSTTTRTITLSNPATITTTLTLTEGTLSNGSNLTLQSGSTIALANGTVGNSLAGNSGYSVVYNPFTSGTSKATGNELTGTVRDLALRALAGTITLAQALVLTGNLSLETGTLDPTTTNYPITLAGNFTNTATLTSRTMAVTFNGTTAQTITATAAPTFYDLVINNTSGGVQLATPIAVTHALTLTSGILSTTATNLPTLGAAASVSGGSAASFVSGPMSHTVSTTASSIRTFPLGKGATYRPLVLTLTQSGNTATTYTAEVFNTAPATRTMPSGITGVSTVRYWTVSSNNATTLTAGSVQLFYGPDDGVASPTETRVLKSNAANWVNLGGTATSVSSGSITSTISFTSPGDFAIGNTAISIVLPVTWISFNAVRSNGGINLTWVTAQESGLLEYVVQKMTGTSSWQDLATVPGLNGASNTYRFRDARPASVNYYRIMQVDLTGKRTWSKTIVVNGDGGKDIDVRPNPATTAIRFLVRDERLLAGGTLRVDLLTPAGATVLSKLIDAQPLVTIDRDGLPAGTYWLIVRKGTVVSRAAVVLGRE
ncbi:MAG: hypothetical protein JWP27_996 [Flaviaesturariibacter sp.]|nr:hypothetical protein [Flaviaesturariibacter sp.]